MGEVVGAVGYVKAEGEGAVVSFSFFGEDFQGGVGLCLGGSVGLVGDFGDVVKEDFIGIGELFGCDSDGLELKGFGVEEGMGCYNAQKQRE